MALEVEGGDEAVMPPDQQIACQDCVQRKFHIAYKKHAFGALAISPGVILVPVTTGFSASLASALTRSFLIRHIRVAAPFPPERALGAVAGDEHRVITHWPQALFDAGNQRVMVALRKIGATD